MIACGKYLRLLALYPVERMMEGISMVKSSYPAIEMKESNNVPAIMIDKDIQGKQSSVAVLRGATIQIARTTPIQTTCTGKYCNKQRPNDWTNPIHWGCGCWGTTSLGTSNKAIMHNISVKYERNIIRMKKFSTQKFNSIFID